MGGREEGAQGRAGRGESGRPERGGQWVSALRQASMPKGAEHEERRVASRRCECRRKESLQWVRAESEGHGNALCRARGVQNDNVQQNNGLCCCSVATKIYFRPGIETFTSISVETLSQILIFGRKHRLVRPYNTQELWMVFTQWVLSILSTNPSLLASITYESNLARSIKLKLNSDGQAEPVPRIAIFFPARPKIWACARPPLMTD